MVNQNRLFKIFVIYFLIVTVFYIFRLGGDYNKLILDSFYLSTFIIEVWTVSLPIISFGSKHPQGKAFSTIRLGLICALLGQTIWFALENVLQLQLLLSPADLLYAIAYPLVFVGFIMSIKAQSITWSGQTKARYIMVFLIGASISYLIYRFEFRSVLLPNIPLTSRIIASFYAIADFMLLILSTMILKLSSEYAGGLMFKPWICVFIAESMILVGDLLFAMFSVQNASNIWPYSIIGLLWFTSNLIVSYGFYGISNTINQAQEMIKNNA